MIVKLSDAEIFKQPGIVGRKYHIEKLFSDQVFVYGELDGEHGERTSGNEPRIYYVINGKGRVEIAGESSDIFSGDLIVIPPNTKYNYWSSNGVLKFILIMKTH